MATSIIIQLRVLVLCMTISGQVWATFLSVSKYESHMILTPSMRGFRSFSTKQQWLTTPQVNFLNPFSAHKNQFQPYQRVCNSVQQLLMMDMVKTSFIWVLVTFFCFKTPCSFRLIIWREPVVFVVFDTPH